MLKFITLGLILLTMWLGPTDRALAAPGVDTAASQGAQEITTEFPAAQIEQFAKAYEAVQAIQQDAEANMATAVADQDLTIDRFNQIATTQEQPDPETTAITEAESDQFADAIEQIVKIRESAQEEMATAIDSAGLDLETFGKILTEARQDADLRQRISDQLNLE